MQTIKKNTVRKNISPLCHCYGNVGEAIFFSDLSCKFQFLSLALKMNVARTVDPFGLGSKFSLAAAATSGAGALAAWGAHSGTIQQWKELTSGAKQIRSES